MKINLIHMKINLNKLYIVQKPTEYSTKVDVFDGKPDTLASLFRQILGGLRITQVHAIYTTKREAQKEADRILSAWTKKTKRKLRGEGWAIFDRLVIAKHKYEAPTPQVFSTKAEAEKALTDAVKKGWKRSRFKILRY